jgi:hypothetical protein
VLPLPRPIPPHILYVALCVVDPLISKTYLLTPQSFLPKCLRLSLFNPFLLAASNSATLVHCQPLLFPFILSETHGAFCFQQRPLLLRVNDADSISLQCQSSWYRCPQRCRWYGPFLWWSRPTSCRYVGVCHWQHLWRHRQVTFTSVLHHLLFIRNHFAVLEQRSLPTVLSGSPSRPY